MLKRYSVILSIVVLVSLFVFPRPQICAEEPTSDELEFFEKKVRPLLDQHCYACHAVTAKKRAAGLLLDSRMGLLNGGDSGAAIVPGDVEASLLVQAVRYESYEMPPQGKLPDSDIRTLERWIELGAPWPVEEDPKPDAAPAEFDLTARQSEHWVWQPILSPTIPVVVNSDWPRSEIDHFILAKLEENNLIPTVDTDRTTLVRRLYFDLIGLPPTIEETTRFLNDGSSESTSRLVDELLASPHFGERWGRHWLDLVRYAESRGHEFDNDALNAYQYRDYVIRAFNEDVPYDQMVREHIAGDLLAAPRLNQEQGFNESILGTGFWFFGEWTHSPVDIRKDETDRFDNMIDVMSKTFLGVTVACARCHDHKFDAISTADYYSLSGFLQSSDFRQVCFDSIEHNRGIAGQLAELDNHYQSLIKQSLQAKGVVLGAMEPLSSELERFVVFDYGSLAPDNFLTDGYLFGERPRRIGEAYLGTVDENPTVMFAEVGAAATNSFWNEMETISEIGLVDRNKLTPLAGSGRTLRTPTFLLADGEVACLVRGTGHVVACVDSHRLVAGPLHGETIVEIKAGAEWVELKLDRYVGHRLHLEFTPSQDKSLEVLLVTQGADAEIRDRLNHRRGANAVVVGAFAIEAERAFNSHHRNDIAAWASARSDLRSKVMKRSRLAIAMMDGTSEDDHVLIRGNSSTPGDVEARHFLTAISGIQPMEIKQGSGRLELADQINAASNPLTSRVIANRIWHYLMGRGIVPTTDDFGVLGQRPTHPELLDYLATQFVADGHSIKQLIRKIVLSRTYQLSSQANAVSFSEDPINSLWHFRPPKRLEGEVIRDALLLISGRLDTKQFGEPVPIHLTSFMDGRGRPPKSGPIDGANRRSIYVAVRRNFLSPFMLAFDTPTPFSTMGRRNVSNVPAQALILMNDPFVIEQAKTWAELSLKKQATDELRINWMYRTALARPPMDRELSVAIEFLKAQAEERHCEPNDAQLWADFAHILINTKEFIFLR